VDRHGHPDAPVYGQARRTKPNPVVNWALVNILILIANLGVLGLTMKLYTEYFKDQSQRNRK
jgi:hypothetical protein